MSFVQYDENCDFPIENLPFGIFSTNNDVSSFYVYILITFWLKIVYEIACKNPIDFLFDELG